MQTKVNLLDCLQKARVGTRLKGARWRGIKLVQLGLYNVRLDSQSKYLHGQVCLRKKCLVAVSFKHSRSTVCLSPIRISILCRRKQED